MAGMWTETHVALHFADLDLFGCSDIHLYRGTEDCGNDFILGHEFTGRVVQAGKDVKKVALGDRVVAAFTTSW